jgi:glycosyltransferase involved in cell wall biosynthesis
MLEGGEAMKVLLVVEPVAKSMGSERVVDSTAKWLRREGIGVAILDPRLDLPLWLVREFDVVHVFNSGGSLRAVLGLVDCVRGEKPIVLTVTYWPPTVGEIRLAEKVMGLDGERIAILMQARAAKDVTLFRIAEEADVLIFTSEREMKAFFEAEESFGFRAKGLCKIVENAVDPEEISEVKIDKEDALCATVGRVEVAKNQWTVIQALRELRKEFPEPRYVSVGRDSLRLGEKVKESWIEFTGEVEPMEALRVLGRAEVHILASLRDTPGLASLEAAALGCKLVVSDDPYGTARDYFPEDMVSFVDPLSSISVYRGIRNELSREGRWGLRELVLGKFSYPKVVKKLIELYNKVR